MKRTKVAVIGVGLLGGSFALALRRHAGFDLVGWNHRASSRRRASKILRVARTLEEAIRGASVVLLGAHSGAVPGLLRALVPYLEKDALVLDVSSLKKAISEDAGRIPGLKGRFVPCHPMAGKEKSGPEAADPRLFEGAWVFLTPIPGTRPGAVRQAESIWRLTGAKTLLWNASDHDRRVALTSHLPHLLACVMMELYGRRRKADRSLPAAVGPGFRDFTRIAAGHPAMWADILRLNKREIAKALREFRLRLQKMEKEVASGNRGRWERFFGDARRLREKL